MRINPISGARKKVQKIQIVTEPIYNGTGRGFGFGAGGGSGTGQGSGWGWGYG